MLFDVNNTISIKRLVESSGKSSYTNTIASGISVYIYKPTDDYSEIGEVEGGMINLKMITEYLDIQVGDKIIDADGIEYIVREITFRKSFIRTFKEVNIMQQYD